MNRIAATFDARTEFAVVSSILSGAAQACAAVPSYEHEPQHFQVFNQNAAFGIIALGGVVVVDVHRRQNEHTFIPPELYFRLLLARWREERGATSSITVMAMCPSYQRIIAMGPDAIALILREMESEGDDPDHWSWALRALTGSNPVPDEARGNMVATARAWLSWARGRYVW